MTKHKIPTHRKAAAALFTLMALAPTQASAPPYTTENPDLAGFYTGTPNNRIGIVAFTGDKARIAAALKLYMQNKADYLLISGYELTHYENPAALAATLQIAVTRDLSGITFDPTAMNTCDSSKIAANWVNENKLDFIIGVTSDYHARRTHTLLQNALPHGTNLNMWAVPSENPENKNWTESLKLTATQLGVCAIPGYQIPGF